jgi:hypothetical protein
VINGVPMKDAALIESFGTAGDLALAVGRKSGVPVSRSAVYEWKRKGIPARWRGIVSALAAEAKPKKRKGAA